MALTPRKKEEHLDWKKLKSMRCPRCGHFLNGSELDAHWQCSLLLCGFKITKERFNNTVHSLYNKSTLFIEDLETNQSELNNL